MGMIEDQVRAERTKRQKAAIRKADKLFPVRYVLPWGSGIAQRLSSIYFKFSCGAA
jgi:hypothetical protein